MEHYSILGKASEDVDIGISTDNYVEGMFLLPFDMTPTSAANMEYLGRKTGGSCRIELQFHKPLPYNIMIITYCKVQPCHASLSYPFCNTAAHMEAMPTREGI